MKTLIFQHTPEECPGSLIEWLKKSGFPFHVHHIYRETELSPELFNHDWLVVLGGPMNVGDTHLHPWLKNEKDFIKKWLATQKPLLGICLGGQLLAECLGGQVSKNPEREIGFHSVNRTRGTHPAFRRWPDSMPVFQWHEDRFSLPPGCESLLTSEVCEHQAYAANAHTVGLQFHPESIESWIKENYEDFTPSPGERFVQSKKECEALLPAKLPQLTSQFFLFLEDFTAEAAKST